MGGSYHYYLEVKGVHYSVEVIVFKQHLDVEASEADLTECIFILHLQSFVSFCGGTPNSNKNTEIG